MIALRLSSGRRAEQLGRRVGHRRAEAVHAAGSACDGVDRDRLVAGRGRRPAASDGCGASFWVSSAVVSHISAWRGDAGWIVAQPAVSASARSASAIAPHATGSAGQNLLHIFVVRRHDVDATVDRRGDVAEELLDLRVALDRDQRIIAARHEALAEEHLDPAFLAEQFVVLAEDAAVRAPQVDLALKRRRQLHRRGNIPRSRRRARSPNNGGR